MSKKSISDIVIDALRLTYSRALFCIVFIVLTSAFFAWSLLISPVYEKLSATKDESRRVLALRNVQLFVSEAQQSVSNVSTLFRACEGAIYAISSDIHSFRKEDGSGNGRLPVLMEFFSGGAYARTVRPNLRHGGSVSYDYPGIYCPSSSCYDSANTELNFLSGYWPQFRSISKKMYAIGPELQWIYIASASGQITMYPALPAVPGDYDPRSRRWYKDSLKTDEVVWIRPYFAAGGSDYVVTVAKKLENIPPLSEAVAGIDINLQSLMANRLSFPYCDKCRLMIADENGNVIAERDMAKKGDWKNAPAPMKLDVVLGGVLKGPDAHLLMEELSAKAVRAERVVGDQYIFSLPIGFLNWRLLGIIPVDYCGSDGLSIIKDLESIIGNARRGSFLVLVSVLSLALLSLGLFFLISRSTIKNRLLPLLGQFVELSRSLKGGRVSEDWKKVDVELPEGSSSEYNDIRTAILSYEKEVETQSRLAAISETAGQVAHDIRSPLAALDSALKDVPEMPTDKRRLAVSALARINEIARDLLENYRKPGAKGPVRPEPMDLKALLEPLIIEKRAQYSVRPEVKIDFMGVAASAAVEPVELRRLVSNLVNNAVESLESGGRVGVELARSDGHVVLKVFDDGKGIPPEILAKLGQKGETHGKAGGTGLGLYHARSTVENWGGRLKVTSEPGKGTTVTVILPAVGIEPLPASAVLIDDDALVRMNWKAAARAKGIELKAFSTPAEFAAAGMDRDTPIYIDSELGEGVKGEELAEELKGKGYSRLFLETGHPPEKFSRLPWLKVGGKEPPWA